MNLSTRKLSITFALAIITTLLTFYYALGTNGNIFLRGFPAPFVSDGSLRSLNFIFDVIIWQIVWIAGIKLVSEFGRNIKDIALIYGIVIFIILVVSLSFLASYQYQIIVQLP